MDSRTIRQIGRHGGIETLFELAFGWCPTYKLFTQLVQDFCYGREVAHVYEKNIKIEASQSGTTMFYFIFQFQFKCSSRSYAGF